MKASAKYCALAMLFLFTSLSFAQQSPALQVIHNRVAQLVTRIGLKPIAPMDSTTVLHIDIGLPLRDQQELTSLLHDLYDPTSPKYHQFLSPSQFTSEFGPTEADYQALIQFAKLNGLTVTNTYSNRLLVAVSARVSVIERALHVHMMMYKHPIENREFYAPDAEPSIDLAVPVLAVGNLSNYVEHRPISLMESSGTHGDTPMSGSGPIAGTYMGNDFRAAYDPGVSLNGYGQKVGLFQFDGYDPSNITYYENLAGLPNVPLSNHLIGVDGQPDGTSDDIEVCLDIEMAISMAPGLDSVVVFEGYNQDQILEAMAKDSSVKQLSSSWTYGVDGTTESLFKEFQAQGQSFFSASGDWDAWDYPANPPIDPTTDTSITIVGGTTLSTTGPGGSYTSETAWNSGYVPADYNYIGTGGGVDTTLAIPSYQLGVSMTTNQGSTRYRNIPDVALTADNIYVRCNTYGSSPDHRVGGTSAAAPLWAGFMALVNQQASALGNNRGVGFINRIIYPIGESNSYTSAFHDITTGNNERSDSPNKYSAVSGYDLCTGWGTPNGQAMINLMSNPIWSGTVTLNSNYSIPSGESLIIEPGTTVQLASGVSIDASGVIDAVGTAAEPITFTSTGGTSPGSWGSIIINGSGAENSTLKYCDINYATDLEVNNTSNVTITNASISNSSGTDISVYNSSSFLAEYDSVAVTNYNTGIDIDGGSNNNCLYNVVYNPVGDGIGIIYNASSGTVGQNDVDYVGSAFLAENGASLNADRYPPNNKNNRATNCAYGLNVYSSSVCDFGDPPGTAYFSNSVHNNTVYDAAVGLFGGSATLYANADYWGSSPSFYVGSSSTGQFGMQLNSDPWNNWPLPSGSQPAAERKVSITDATEKSDNPHIQVQSPSASPTWLDSLFAGSDLRQSGHIAAARDYFISFISNHPTNVAGYVELYGCSNDTTLPGILNLFKAPPTGAPKMVQYLLAHLYEMDNQPKLAIQVNDKIITGYPNTPLGVKAEISNMLIDLYDMNDLTDAETLLDSIEADSSQLAPMDLYAAKEALAVHGGPPVSGSQKATSIETINLPKSFGLSQNYPNPFNPTTQINYQLPKDAHVTLKVYDVLGQLVATLVDGEVSAGYHKAIFDGATYASGVYFYRISTPGYSRVMKMLMLK